MNNYINPTYLEYHKKTVLNALNQDENNFYLLKDGSSNKFTFNPAIFFTLGLPWFTYKKIYFFPIFYLILIFFIEAFTYNYITKNIGVFFFILILSLIFISFIGNKVYFFNRQKKIQEYINLSQKNDLIVNQNNVLLDYKDSINNFKITKLKKKIERKFKATSILLLPIILTIQISFIFNINIVLSSFFLKIS